MSTSTGPKIDISAVQVAIKAVQDGQQSMENVTLQILAQAGASEQAMKAPAGQITSQTFGDLGGGGKALSDELGKLMTDLQTLIKVANAGSDQATAAAKAGSGNGQATSVANRM